MIALILARGGSKGLPGKNIRRFQDKPLIAHTIEAALQSRAIERVVVSTDDDGIAAVSRQYGADIPFMRPSELASDTAGAKEAMLHAVDYLSRTGCNMTSFCLLQPTSPLRTSDDIDAAHELFLHRKANAVLSVTPYEHPVQWAVRVSDNGEIAPREVVSKNRRQDLTRYYRPNGAIYFFKQAFIRICGDDYMSSRSYGYIMPLERSVDIDTPLDFVVAEAVARYLESNHAE